MKQRTPDLTYKLPNGVLTVELESEPDFPCLIVLLDGVVIVRVEQAVEEKSIQSFVYDEKDDEPKHKQIVRTITPEDSVLDEEEYCNYCCSTVEIPNAITPCPVCGELITPCNRCDPSIDFCDWSRSRGCNRFPVAPNPYKSGDRIISTPESDWSDLRGTVVDVGVGPNDETGNDGPYCMCEFDAVVAGSKAEANLKQILGKHHFDAFPNTFGIMTLDEIRADHFNPYEWSSNYDGGIFTLSEIYKVKADVCPVGEYGEDDANWETEVWGLISDAQHALWNELVNCGLTAKEDAIPWLTERVGTPSAEAFAMMMYRD